MSSNAPTSAGSKREVPSAPPERNGYGRVSMPGSTYVPKPAPKK